jgi:hypothetical protein
MYQSRNPGFHSGLWLSGKGHILVDTNRIAMGLATCSLACDWTSRAVGLTAVRRAVNILTVLVCGERVKNGR